MVKIDFDRPGLDIAWGATHKYWDGFPADSAANGAAEGADALAERIELQREFEAVALMTVLTVQKLLMVAGADALAKQNNLAKRPNAWDGEFDREFEDVKPMTGLTEHELKTAEDADALAENGGLDHELEHVEPMTVLTGQELMMAQGADALAKQEHLEPDRDFQGVELMPVLSGEELMTLIFPDLEKPDECSQDDQDFMSEQELMTLIVPDLEKRLMEECSHDDQELMSEQELMSFIVPDLEKRIMEECSHEDQESMSEQELMTFIVPNLEKRIMEECSHDDQEFMSEHELMTLIVPNLENRLMEECSKDDQDIMSEQELTTLIVPNLEKRLMEECLQDDQEIIEQASKRTKKEELGQHQQAIEETISNPNCWSFFASWFKPTPYPTVKPAIEQPLLRAADPDLERALCDSAELTEAKELSIAIARVRLQGVMEMFQAKARPVEADGNCQFRALALQLHGNEDEHAKVRSATVEWLKRMQERYCDFIHEPFEDYLNRMACNGEWGDNVTLQAASDMLHRDIHIFSDQPGAERVWVHPAHTAAPVTEKPLWLAFIAEMHYDAVEFA